jgi:hypothetical protein
LAAAQSIIIDRFLVTDPTTGCTVLNWLRWDATGYTAPQLVEALKKIICLLDMGVDTWDLIALNPNRVKWLAQLGWKAPFHQLLRMESIRRYPILVAFLHQALVHHPDVAVELYDQCSSDMVRTSRTFRTCEGHGADVATPYGHGRAAVGGGHATTTTVRPPVKSPLAACRRPALSCPSRA